MVFIKIRIQTFVQPFPARVRIGVASLQTNTGQRKKPFTKRFEAFEAWIRKPQETASANGRRR
jgi:hypothetical protein